MMRYELPGTIDERFFQNGLKSRDVPAPATNDQIASYNLGLEVHRQEQLFKGAERGSRLLLDSYKMLKKHGAGLDDLPENRGILVLLGQREEIAGLEELADALPKPSREMVLAVTNEMRNGLNALEERYKELLTR